VDDIGPQMMQFVPEALAKGFLQQPLFCQENFLKLRFLALFETQILGTF
jgi:hypothetical protein